MVYCLIYYGHNEEWPHMSDSGKRAACLLKKLSDVFSNIFVDLIFRQVWCKEQPGNVLQQQKMFHSGLNVTWKVKVLNTCMLKVSIT